MLGGNSTSTNALSNDICREIERESDVIKVLLTVKFNK